MGAARGRQPPPLERRLFDEPERFDFFQAVRVLHAVARDAAARTRSPAGPGVGRDAEPRAEPVRFRTQPSLTFPASPIVSLAPAAGGDDPSPPELVVSFFGLLGTAGPLPDHYTELVIRRLRARDRTLRDFLALFDHRALSFFYRAWEKYRFPALFEGAAAARGGDDPVTRGLFGLVGRATGGQRGRMEVHDDAFVRFSGHFSRRTRPAVCLEAMLADYFDVPVKVEQFQGEMLRLPLPERTVLPSRADPRGRHTRLGGGAILGGHAHDVQGRFRIRVGPLSIDGFRSLMPTGDLLRPFCQLARSYVGPDLAFDVRPVLRPDQAPPIRLGADPPDSPRLGWNTFLRAEPILREFDGVSFSLDPS